MKSEAVLDDERGVSPRRGKPSPETLYRLAREGHLPVKRIGRVLVISETRYDEWMDLEGDARAVVYDGVALNRVTS